jgi:hypothetical protein
LAFWTDGTALFAAVKTRVLTSTLAFFAAIGDLLAGRGIPAFACLLRGLQADRELDEPPIFTRSAFPISPRTISAHSRTH